jgi:biopolymer transport protein ExbB
MFESLGMLAKGGIIMIPIFICSIVGLTIIIERFIYFRKSSEDPEKTFEALTALMKTEGGFHDAAGEHPDAVKFFESSTGPVGRLMEAGLNHKDVPRWKLEEKLSVVGQEELNKLGKNIRGLEVIATISPLMGLLGTVMGMVQAFNKVAQYKGQVDPSILAGGIWEALLTTAAGLAVAIPVVVMLHFFDRKIEQISFLLEKFGQLLIHHFDEEREENNSGNVIRSVQPELAKTRG